ncbi:MAG: c-type cytochrome [Burkholderiaceae bacterium]
MSAEHEAFIKTPKQLIITVVLAFVVPVVLIIFLSNYVGSVKRIGAGADSLSEEATIARIAPVGGFELAGASGPVALKSGEEVYNAQCGACHTSGAAGAPKLGDTAAWAPRLAAGYEALLTSALKGKGAMAAQGGGAFGDVEIGRAVVYMTNQAGGDFPVPEPE